MDLICFALAVGLAVVLFSEEMAVAEIVLLSIYVVIELSSKAIKYFQIVLGLGLVIISIPTVCYLCLRPKSNLAIEEPEPQIIRTYSNLTISSSDPDITYCDYCEGRFVDDNDSVQVLC